MNDEECKALEYMNKLARNHLVSHPSQASSRNDTIINNAYNKFGGRISKERLVELFINKE